MFLDGQKLHPYIPMAKAMGFTGAVDKYDTLILQYTQDGVRKSYVNGNHVDDIVFAG